MGLTLAQQLKQLNEDTPSSKTVDVDEAGDLDAHELRADREHYLDVGPSRLRSGGVDGLDSARYGGKTSSRMKIFDDDDEEEEEGDGSEEEGNEEEGEGDDDEDEDDEDETEDEEDEDEDDEDEEDVEDEEDEEEQERPRPSGKALDPVSALRESREKDVQKGRGIKRQRDLFDSILTLRITFQKALTSSFQLPSNLLADDPAGEIETKREEALRSLAELNNKLFTLREGITLPGTESRKRRKLDDPTSEEYWTQSAADEFAISEASHPQLIPILNKWSTKIQAASLQLGKGANKFTQSKAVGVVDAIDAAISQKRDSTKSLLESEEMGYRALLREVIESRQGGGQVDLMHLRREKKKKREAERGGSKGRKLRYTVHEKAANFVVPIPLENEWHEEQVDELFASLFGGVGLKGAFSTEPEVEKTELGGLKVF